MKTGKKKTGEKNKPGRAFSRREFLKTAAVVSTAAALGGCGSMTKEEFFQKHFKTLTKPELDQIIQRLEAGYWKKYHKKFTVSATGPMAGTEFAYALDISTCIGCRRCVYGCVEENNLSRDPQVHWIQVLEMEEEKGVDFLHSDLYYDREEVPVAGHFYLPVSCQMCKNPPCVKTCPVEATWQEPDGLVVVDYNWCIGCRCCMASCPYSARHFNWGEPNVPAEKMNPHTHYLGNRPNYKSVVGKCTFCVQRVREGRYPKCVEVCPVGARKFGNILDPDDEIRYILQNKRVLILKEDLNTQPNFFYYFGT
ncbi:MAG TPA: 4Fe-4S dicluster domain-containing protein [Candidatus Deferrimicrobium sp.]|nr:4Fe-4S dicluster domain-containing protein [Candidatus Deferrimicrobium sp.]